MENIHLTFLKFTDNEKFFQTAKNQIRIFQTKTKTSIETSKTPTSIHNFSFSVFVQRRKQLCVKRLPPSARIDTNKQIIQNVYHLISTYENGKRFFHHRSLGFPSIEKNPAFLIWSFRVVKMSIADNFTKQKRIKPLLAYIRKRVP